MSSFFCSSKVAIIELHGIWRRLGYTVGRLATVRSQVFYAEPVQVSEWLPAGRGKEDTAA